MGVLQNTFERVAVCLHGEHNRSRPSVRFPRDVGRTDDPRKDHHGVNLISDALPFGRLWYSGPDAINNAMGYAKRRSPSTRALIRVYDQGGNGSAFTHVVLCAAAAAPPKVHMGKVSPTFIDITLCTCVWQ